MANEAQLTIGEKQVTLPIVESTEGNNGVDVSSLLKDTGDTTFDVGFAHECGRRPCLVRLSLPSDGVDRPLHRGRALGRG